MSDGTMLDRVALAILHSHCAGNNVEYSLENDMDGFRDDARAALKALRDPTNAMLVAMFSALGEAPVGSDDNSDMTRSWQAAIDAVLAP